MPAAPQRSPTGLQYIEGAVSPALWGELQVWLVSDPQIPWERAVEGRRVAQWGYRYDYQVHDVDRTPVAPIPPALRKLIARETSRFTQCIINEYTASDGIPWHTDHPSFGPEILVFSFGAPRALLLRKPGVDGVDFSLKPQHCSAYRLVGEARNEWQHCVLGGPLAEGAAGIRYSMTFRSAAAWEEGTEHLASLEPAAGQAPVSDLGAATTPLRAVEPPRGLMVGMYCRLELLSPEKHAVRPRTK